MVRLFLFLFLIGLPITGWAQSSVEPRPLTSIKSVRELEPEEAGQQLPVVLEGQVVRLHPRRHGIFLFDGDYGIYVRLGVLPGEVHGVVAGDIIRVIGRTERGHLFPSIYPEQMERIGHEPLPEARIFSLHELYDTKIDSDWVSVRGRITSMEVVHGYEVIVIGIEMNGIEVAAQLPFTKEAYDRVKELMFRLVRFDAVAGSVYNRKRQLTGRIFFVNSADDITPIRKESWDANPREFEIHELMRVGTKLREVIITQGVVTSVSGEELFLRGEESSLRVAMREPVEFEPGDRVQLKGLVWPQEVSPAFRALDVEVLESGPAPSPIFVELPKQIDPGLNYELIEIDAKLVNIGKSFDFSPLSADGEERVTLLCRSGSYTFEANLPPGVVPPELLPGAQLRLTGICELITNPKARWHLYIDGLVLQLRGLDDIQVLNPAPWWTTERLFSVMAVLLAVLLIALVWALVLRRTVEKQTSVIGQQIERQTILDERQRIARELHDNLEQGLAGMAIQLRGVFKLLNRLSNKAENSIIRAIDLSIEDSEKLNEHLEGRLLELAVDAKQSQRALNTVQDMLMHCSEESRASILDLRAGLLERMDLPSAVKVALEPLAEAADTELGVEVQGSPRRLQSSAERNLLLIAREAVTNAVRHGSPQHVNICLSYSLNAFRLTVTDDGHGFDPRNSSRPGHFGLVGMRERVSRLGGKIRIESQIKQGTTVEVELTDTKDLEKD
ncbi:MAG: ATP-binding protein [Verrucomicrobiota bacterium]